MRVREVNGHFEILLLASLCFNKDACRLLAPVLENHLSLLEPPLHFPVQWALRYYNKYGEPLGSSYKTAFDLWSRRHSREEDVIAVRSVLERIQPPENLNIDYLVDSCAAYLNERSLRRLLEHAQWELNSGEPDKAENLVLGWKQIEIGRLDNLEVIDEQRFAKIFSADETESLIRFEEPWSDFFKNAFCRDSLIGVMGPEKSKKTWFLIEIAWQALANRRRVAFFEVGDMSERQILRRLAVRIAGRPWRAGCVQIPQRVVKLKGKDVDVDFDVKSWESDLNWEEFREKLQIWRERKLRTHESLFRLGVYDNNSISAEDIRGLLEVWSVREGWVPDFVIVDYADLLKGTLRSAEPRDNVNQTWKILRQISQQFHCSVVTATQTNATSYQASVIQRHHFSEDHRKLAHVTAMYGITATEREKSLQVCRLNCVLAREFYSPETHCLFVGHCLELGKLFCTAGFEGEPS